MAEAVHEEATERALFGLVAHHARAPSSKLAAAECVNDVHIAGLDRVDDNVCHRAMDWLHPIREKLERQVFDSATHLLNLRFELLLPAGHALRRLSARGAVSTTDG